MTESCNTTSSPRPSSWGKVSGKVSALYRLPGQITSELWRRSFLPVLYSSQRFVTSAEFAWIKELDLFPTKLRDALFKSCPMRDGAAIASSLASMESEGCEYIRALLDLWMQPVAGDTCTEDSLTEKAATTSLQRSLQQVLAPEEKI
eukprot:scaffold6078_cov229-Pinguiococcus_pyrenoidosus.AAC.2